MSTIEEPDKAIRLARAIASDISLYNEEKVKDGIMQDCLFEVLSAELQEGYDLYRSRVSTQLDAEATYYWQAVVNIIVRAKGHLPAQIW
ncbi:MAG: hypothetical protein EOO40_04245 [Deltaproteobacteria bacterium]|nr:MAG: hypothetical protein EOO40_04245 [Deltaproteobacteria bacterium]